MTVAPGAKFAPVIVSGCGLGDAIIGLGDMDVIAGPAATCRLAGADAVPPGLVTTTLHVRGVMPGLKDAAMAVALTLATLRLTGVPPV